MADWQSECRSLGSVRTPCPDRRAVRAEGLRRPDDVPGHKLNREETREV